MISRMSIKEFKDQGYLQEVNRQFLHPLGLALEVTFDPDTNDMKLGGIWDCRDQPNGVIFEKVDAKKAVHIIKLQRKVRQARVDLLSHFIQPIGKANV